MRTRSPARLAMILSCSVLLGAWAPQSLAAQQPPADEEEASGAEGDRLEIFGLSLPRPMDVWVGGGLGMASISARLACSGFDEFVASQPGWTGECRADRARPSFGISAGARLHPNLSLEAGINTLGGAEEAGTASASSGAQTLRLEHTGYFDPTAFHIRATGSLPLSRLRDALDPDLSSGALSWVPFEDLAASLSLGSSYWRATSGSVNIFTTNAAQGAVPAYLGSESNAGSAHVAEGGSRTGRPEGARRAGRHSIVSEPARALYMLLQQEEEVQDHEQSDAGLDLTWGLGLEYSVRSDWTVTLSFDRWGLTAEEEGIDETATEVTIGVRRPLGPTRPRPGGPGTTPRAPDAPPEIPEFPEDPIPSPPPPTIYGEEVDDSIYCCGKTDRFITYPVTTHPLVPADPQPAPRDPAVAAAQVLLPEGAFFHNERDLHVKAVGFPLELTRHHISNIEMEQGGPIGDRWDFSWNKRIVPAAARRLADGLWVEQPDLEDARLFYYNGQGRADPYVETHEEDRLVLNFGTRTPFWAFVTTYGSPPGAFHEIQRYIVHDPEDHPFAGHPNVDDLNGESIFYVLREKNGLRYIFNCRGQLIYILSRHDIAHTAGRTMPAGSAAENLVRVQFIYDNATLDPLTQSPFLQQVRTASGHVFNVTPVMIDRANLDTNFECRPERGPRPIPRIDEISGEGLSVKFSYTQVGDRPALESVTVDYGDVAETRTYTYDVARRLQGVTEPEQAASADGAMHIANTYTGDGRVEFQRLAGGSNFRLGYAGSSVTVTDANDTAWRYELEEKSGHMVIAGVRARGGPDGEEQVTRFTHNDATQVTSITFPRGNRMEFEYDGGNERVRRGPIYNWLDAGLVYESNLSEGNLLSVTEHPAPNSDEAEAEQTLVTRLEYEPLFNQLRRHTDPAGTIVEYEFDTGYASKGAFGNSIAMNRPELTNPDGATVRPPPVRYEYNPRGQVTLIAESPERRTRFDYDRSGYLAEVTLPDGATRSYATDPLGRVLSEGGSAGPGVEYELDGRGLVTRKVEDPGGLAHVTRYAYDLNRKVTELRMEVKDDFEDHPGEKPETVPAGELVVRTEYDRAGRPIEERLEGGGQTIVRTMAYDARGNLRSSTEPSPRGGTVRTDYGYDAFGRLVTETRAAGTTEPYITRHEYDANGNRVRSTASPDERPVTSVLRYDGFDRLVATEDARGTETRMTRDALGQTIRLETVGPTGAGTVRETLFLAEFDYDEMGNAIARTIHTLAPEDQTLSTEWYYGPDLQVERTVEPGGAETSFEYDAMGRAVEVIDPVGHLTRIEYDRRGRREHVEETVPEWSYDPESGWRIEERTYDWRFDYDGLDRLTATAGPGVAEQYFYNSLDRQRGSLEGDELTEITYDGLGRRLRVERDDGFQRFEYNAAGLITEVETPAHHEVWEFDQLGRTIAQTDRKTGATTRTERDVHGNALVTTDANGTTIRRAFNSLGLPTELEVEYGASSVQVPDASLPALAGPTLETYEYDGLGRVVRAASSDDVETVIAYDGLSHPIRESQRIAGLTETFTRSYAADGRWAEVVYPEAAGGARVRHVYDRTGRTQRVEVDGDPVAEYRYAGRDRVAGRTDGNGVTTAYRYDDERRLTDIQTVGPDGGPVWSARTEYRGGRPERITQIDNTEGTTSTTSFTYDDRDRRTGAVTRMSGPGEANSTVSGVFSTFRDGRLAAMAEFLYTDTPGLALLARTDSLEYDAEGRLTAVTSRARVNAETTGPPSSARLVGSIVDETGILVDEAVEDRRELTYDANGNVISDGNSVFAYDHANRMTRAALVRGPNAYGYRETLDITLDNFGRRVHVAPQRERLPGIGFRDFVWDRPTAREPLAFLYDGRETAAEVPYQPGVPGVPFADRLLSRYFPGARPGERVRMDRRTDDEPAAELQRFYLHAGLDREVVFLTDTNGRAFKTVNDAGAGAGAAVRPPDDMRFVRGTRTRIPYLTWNVRVDGAGGLKYDEIAQTPVFDYRATPILSDELDRRELSQSIGAYQTTGLAALGAITLTPFALAALPSVGAAAWAHPWAATQLGVVGGGINVGAGAALAYALDRPYTVEDAAVDFTIGAVTAGGSGALALGGATIGRQLATDAMLGYYGGVMADVTWRGRGLGEAMVTNTISAGLSAGIGLGIGRLSPAVRAPAPRAGLDAPTGARAGTSDLARAAEPAAPAAMAPPPVAAGAARPVTGPSPFIRWVDRSGQVTSKNAEMIALEKAMLWQLRNGTKVSRKIGELIERGEIGLSFEPFTGRWARAHGLYRPGEPVLRVNRRILRQERNNLYLASIAVHEGVHFLGGGEVAAFTAQAQFGVSRLGSLVARNPSDVFPDGRMLLHLMAHRWRQGREAGVLGVMNFMGYGTTGGTRIYKEPMSNRIHPWVDAQGGFDRLLGVSPAWAELFRIGARAHGLGQW